MAIYICVKSDHFELNHWYVEAEPASLNGACGYRLIFLMIRPRRLAEDARVLIELNKWRLSICYTKVHRYI